MAERDDRRRSGDDVSGEPGPRRDGGCRAASTGHGEMSRDRAVKLSLRSTQVAIGPVWIDLFNFETRPKGGVTRRISVATCAPSVEE